MKYIHTHIIYKFRNQQSLAFITEEYENIINETTFMLQVLLIKRLRMTNLVTNVTRGVNDERGSTIDLVSSTKRRVKQPRHLSCAFCSPK